MFKNYDEFSHWLEISKNFDSRVIKDIYEFINTFPYSDFTDYIKASKKIAKGDDVKTVINNYKRHLKSIGEKDDDDYIEILTMQDCIDEMLENARTGQLKGSSTHIDLIDKCWKWRPTEFTLLTGYNNDGKSLLIRILALIKGLKDNWKTVINAPEDYPASAFFEEIIHTASGYSTDKDNPNYIGEKLYKQTYEQVKPYFTFVNIRPPKNTLEAILSSFVPIIEKEKCRICIIDPLVKITRPAEYVNNDAAWAAYVTSVCVDFARRYDVCLILVLHQLTPRIQENGMYAKPDKYSIKHGGNLSDSSDNVLFLQKPMAPKDNLDTLVRFGSLKIKKQKLVAVPQEVQFRYNRFTNRYITEDEKHDLFDFDHLLGIKRMRLLTKPKSLF